MSVSGTLKFKGFRQFVEDGNRTAVISFGRFQPPTIGHQKLVDKLKSIAAQNNGDPMLFLSHTQDKDKNPLSYDQKLKYAQFAFGDIPQESSARTIIQVLQALDDKYGNIILVFGDDRIAQFKEMINKYNGKEYNFNSIEFASSGERDPDADGVEGMSASKLRQLAKDGNFQEFKTGVPLQEPEAEDLYHDLRIAMGVD